MVYMKIERFIMKTNLSAVDEIRCGWLILFITSLVVGFCAVFVEMTLIIKNKSMAEPFGITWLLFSFCFSSYFAWSLYRHAYKEGGTKLAQTVQWFCYIMLAVGVVSLVIVAVGFSKGRFDQSPELYTGIMEILRRLPFMVPCLYFLVYNHRLIRVNRQAHVCVEA